MKKRFYPSYLIYALIVPLFVLFVLWVTKADYSGIAMIAAVVSCGMFGYCLVNYAEAFEKGILGQEAAAPEITPRNRRFDRRHPWAGIALCVLALHIAMYILAYNIDLADNGYSGGILDTLKRLWLRTDGPHYLGIAENWYVTEGDARFHIVFFPLYPILTKLFYFVTGDYFAAAMVLSTLCAIGSAIAAYELASLDMDKKGALFAAAALSLFPGSIFLAAPMTEGLFLMLSLLCVLFARKRKYIAAGIFGALAAFTRSAGALLCLPVFIEALCEWLPDKKLSRGDIALRLIGAALPALGTLGYLLINYSVTGDAFTFLTYQREHWSQGLGPFYGTAAYQTDLFISHLARGDARMAYTLFLPNLLCCFAALGIFQMTSRRMRASYGGYALVYYAFSVGATWLLSGPRYLAVCFPLAIGLAELVKNRLLRIAAVLLLTAGMVIYLAMYISGGCVY